MGRADGTCSVVVARGRGGGYSTACGGTQAGDEGPGAPACTALTPWASVGGCVVGAEAATGGYPGGRGHAQPASGARQSTGDKNGQMDGQVDGRTRGFHKSKGAIPSVRGGF